MALTLLTAIYYGFATNVHLVFGEDALVYAYWVENGIVTSINRHFLWNFLYFYVFKLWTVLGADGGALAAGKMLSALFGAGGVLVFYHVMKEVLGARRLVERLLFTGFYASSFAYWHFSGEANPQVFSNFLRLALLLFLLKRREGQSYPRVAIFGAVFAGVLLSEILGFALFFSFVALVFFYPDRHRYVKAGLFAGVAVVLFYVSYGVIAHSLLGYRIAEIPMSIFYRAPRETSFFANLPVASGYLLLALAYIPQLLSTSWPARELNLAGVDPWAVITGAIVVGLLLVSIGLGLKYRRSLTRDLARRGLLWGCALWFLVPFLFQVKREPNALDNLFYLIPPVWVLAGAAWNELIKTTGGRHRLIARLSLGAILALFVVNNFCAGIYPNSRHSAFAMYPCGRDLQRHVSRDDVVVLFSSRCNYHLYELGYLLRHRLRHNTWPVVLDACEHRALVPSEALHRSLSRTLADLKGRDAYVVTIPGQLASRGTILRRIEAEMGRANPEFAKIAKITTSALSTSYRGQDLVGGASSCGLVRLRRRVRQESTP